MTYTSNYNLKKPETGDYAGPGAFNDNAEIIDAQMKANAAAAAAAVPKSAATAADQVLVSTAAGTWGVKTLAQFKTWLALAATNISDFAVNLHAECKKVD